MTSNPLLNQQIREHLGDDVPVSDAFRRFLAAVGATYARLGHAAPSEDPPPLRHHALSAVFDSIAAGVVVRDINDRIIEHNKGAERILGLDFERMRGLSAVESEWKLVRPDGSEHPWSEIPSRMTIRDGRPRYGVVMGLMAPGKGLRWLAFSSEPLCDGAGSVVAAISTFSDLSDIVHIVPVSAASDAGLPNAGGARPRVSLAMIAERAGLSTAAVSMALRRHRRISAETQEKVRAIAEQLGYRPDPRLGRAMYQMRMQKRAAFRSVIAALTDLPSLNGHYVAEMLEAARRRADHLGYGFTVEQFSHESVNAGKLNQSLFSRGIEGLLLLPMAHACDCRNLVEWTRYSVVAANYAVRTPDFDRVVSNWYASIRGVFTALAARGYRRIGAVINKAFDDVVSSKISSGIVCAQLQLNIAPVETFYHCSLIQSAPQYHPEAGLSDRCISPEASRRHCLGSIGEWFLRERPDALVFDCESMATVVLDELGRDAASSVGVATLTRRPGARYSGWEEKPAVVGEMAVEWLDQKIKAFEKGPPSSPSIRMVTGSWGEGSSTRPSEPVTASLFKRCPAHGACDKCETVGGATAVLE